MEGGGGTKRISNVLKHGLPPGISESAPKQTFRFDLTQKNSGSNFMYHTRYVDK